MRGINKSSQAYPRAELKIRAQAELFRLFGWFFCIEMGTAQMKQKSRCPKIRISFDGKTCYFAEMENKTMS